MTEQPPRPKQAACLVCRRSKIKCDWMPYEAKCRRCIHLNCECIRPEFHPGRQKGIKKQASPQHVKRTPLVLYIDQRLTG